MHRILYIDDDEILVQLVRKVLRRAGYDVLHAEDADSAIAVLERESVAAIVLDHYLRDGTGHDLLARFRERGWTAPVVYVTASSDANVAVQALRTGAADYVMKTSGDEFMALLERSLRQSIANADLQRQKEQADLEMRRAKERAEALLIEVNHRVANSLALVISLLRLQASASDSEELKAVLSDTCGRISAIVNVHRSLYHDEEVHEVRVDRYLQDLVTDLSRTLPDHVRLVLDAAPVSISSDRAVATGIIVTELVANAAKYAYPDGAAGEVRVRLRRLEPGRVRLTVEDDGVGGAPVASASEDEGNGRAGSGLGQRIVRSMCTSLGAELKVTTGGTGTRAEAEFATGVADPPTDVASVA